MNDDIGVAARLLAHLKANAGRVQSREVLLLKVWRVPEGSALVTRRVDATVVLLRRRMGKRCPIVTVRGLGYIVNPKGE